MAAQPLLTIDKQIQIVQEKEMLLWLALRHHRTHKKEPLNFEDHKYLCDIYADKSPYMVVIKSTQCGISEYELVRSIAHALMGLNVFIAFPTDLLVSRFVSGRFKKSLQSSSYYKTLEQTIRDRDEKRTDSMRMIDIGPGNVCYVGSNSEANFTEYPADEIIIEELDQCNPNNIKMAPERLSHSEYRWQLFISNPTYEGLRIDEKYLETDQREWQLKADCGHWIKLDWFKHFVQEIDGGKYMIRDEDWTWDSERDISPVCHKCGKLVNRRNPGEWIAEAESRNKRGYRITKLFSGKTSIIEMLGRFQAGLTDDREKQRFYNADLGQAFTSEGSKISIAMLQKCVGDYPPGPEAGVILAGIDVGSYYNYVIARALPDGRIKVLMAGKERDTDHMINILQEYKVVAGVIDGLPETRASKKIASKFKLVLLCYYGSGKNDSIDLPRKTITVQRTPALDAVKEAVTIQNIIFPMNIMSDTEFVNQMTASTRVVNKDVRNGETKVSVDWVEGSKPDHYFHAMGYCLIAKRLIVLINNR